MKHLLHALESRRHKLAIADAELDQILAEVKDARDVKGPEQFNDSLEKVLSDLRSLTEAHAFLKPVTKSDAPDYHLVIKHPMDLGTMGRKVRNKQYRTKAEFIADLNLIWDNCLTYNAHPTHPLRRCANFLRKRTAILAEIIQDPSERSAPLTLRKMPSHLRRRSVLDDSDDDYSSASVGKVNGKARVNGVVKAETVNGRNGINGRVSSTPESDVPMRPAIQRARGSGPSRRPPPEEAFPERTAITRTPESMSQFHALDKELSRLEAELELLDISGLQRHLDTAGAGPSRVQEQQEDFMREESTKRLRSQLRQLRTNDEDVSRLDEWREVDDGKHIGGGKRKRVVITSSDEDEDEAPRRTKFSVTGLPPDAEEHETNYDLWWEAMRSGGMIGNGMLPMAQHGFPPIKPGSTKRRKKRPKSKVTGLKGMIYKNISTLHNIRRAHSKILVLNAMAEESAGAFELPPDDDAAHPEPLPIPIPGLTLAEDSGATCLNAVSMTVLQHAGFEGSSQASLDVLQHVAADYLMNVGRTFRFMIDKFGKSMSNEQIILHALAEHGISEVQELERYVKDDVERYGSRLQDLERKLVHAYDEQTQAAVIEDDELFDEENEALVMGGFAGELGEDFFGLRELGLDQEFGLTSLSIPRKLLRGRRDNAANANSAKEPQLPYPPPTPFVPIHTAKLESHIGLLHPYYLSKAGSAPPTDGSELVGVALLDDPINNLKVKMGPLGQIISVAPNAGKKKGGGGGGGGGAAPSAASEVKPEGSKTPKKKKEKPKPAAPVSTEPPLTMPNFGLGKAAAPVPPPTPEVSTMMPDFSAFVSGVHAGI